jgi:hypothetical protein
MPRTRPNDALADALGELRVSPNEHDSNLEAANVVNALFAAGRIIRHGLNDLAAADRSNRVAGALAPVAAPMGRLADAVLARGQSEAGLVSGADRPRPAAPWATPTNRG